MKTPTIEFREVIVIDLPDSEGFEAPTTDRRAIKRDVIGYAAKGKGVPRWHLAAWLTHHDRQGLCSGVTKAGRPCNAGAVTDYPTLKGFRDGQDNRCRLHQINAETPL